jgi:hypothetical protein
MIDNDKDRFDQDIVEQTYTTSKHSFYTIHCCTSGFACTMSSRKR